MPDTRCTWIGCHNTVWPMGGFWCTHHADMLVLKRRSEREEHQAALQANATAWGNPLEENP